MDADVSRSRYDEMRAAFPAIFANPRGAPIEVLFDPADVAAAELAAGEALAARGLPMSWARTGVAYQDQYLTIIRDAVRMPSGRLGTYVRSVSAREGAGVVILPRYGNHLVLVRHFRHSTRSWHLEAPRGFGEAGLQPEANARRELQEEIGVEATSLMSLGVVYPDSGKDGDAVHLFHAAIDDVPAVVDEDEGIDAVELVTGDELGNLIRDGEINDGFTMAAYTRAKLRSLF